MGGYLAALYAARHRQVAKLLLLAPAFGFARRWPKVLGPQRTEQWMRERFLEVYHYGDRKHRRIGYQLIEDGQRYEEEPEFAQPAWIFHGSRDSTVPPEISRSFAAKRPNVRLTIVDSDHELVDALDHIWQQAGAFILDPGGQQPA